jgi:hypothetical protein
VAHALAKRDLYDPDEEHADAVVRQLHAHLSDEHNEKPDAECYLCEQRQLMAEVTR